MGHQTGDKSRLFTILKDVAESTKRTIRNRKIQQTEETSVVEVREFSLLEGKSADASQKGCSENSLPLRGKIVTSL